MYNEAQRAPSLFVTTFQREGKERFEKHFGTYKNQYQFTIQIQLYNQSPTAQTPFTCSRTDTLHTKSLVRQHIPISRLQRFHIPRRRRTVISMNTSSRLAHSNPSPHGIFLQPLFLTSMIDNTPHDIPGFVLQRSLIPSNQFPLRVLFLKFRPRWSSFTNKFDEKFLLFLRPRSRAFADLGLFGMVFQRLVFLGGIVFL